MTSELQFPFAFVGCWNQPGATEADDAATPRNAVAAAVTAEPDIKHIVLGGDNVYPRPIVLADGKKNKTHDSTVFNEGLALYRTNGKEVVGAFGNHNVEILEHQKAEFRIAGETYYERMFVDGKTHLLVLDTNIMSDASMLTWFRATVASIPVDHFYFVVQHEPYFVARQKKFVELADADPYLNIMFARPPIAILCADTHNFQHDTIQYIGDDGAPNTDMPLLHQIIVGTGGANPDAYREGFSQEVLRGRYLFRQLLAIPGFGYLYVENPAPAAYQCLFKPVMEWPGQEGGKRRSLKNRRSRITRKSGNTRSQKRSCDHNLWRNVRNQIGGYSVNNARLYENTRWEQLGSHRINIDGVEYNWRGSRNGEFIMYRFGPKTECALLLTDRNEAGDLFGILQNVRNGSNCSASSYATTKDLMKAVWNLAYQKHIRYIEFTDESKIICPTKERVSLSALYFLTYGKTWYETVWPIIPKQPERVARLREHVMSVSWDVIYSRLNTEAKAHFLPAYPDIEPSEPGSANRVMKYLMRQDWCKSIGHFHVNLLAAFDAVGIHSVTWRTIDITGPIP